MSALPATVERKGLPANTDAEKFVLGSLLLNPSAWTTTRSTLAPSDFSLEKHRRIFAAMESLVDQGIDIDRVTLANELMSRGQLESVDGLGYIVSLDDGLPEVSNLDSYVRIVKDKSLRRQVISTSVVLAEMATGDSDIQSVLSRANGDFLALASTMPTDRLYNIEQIIEQTEGGLDGLLRGSSGRSGIPTRWSKLDEMTGGLHRGSLMIIAARPAMGKTAIALNIAERVSDQSKIAAVFSLEMTRESLLLRLLQSRARVDGQRIRSGSLSQEERIRLLRAASEVSERIFIDDSSSLDLVQLASKLRKLKAESGLDVVIVDYLQLMDAGSRYRGQRVQEVSELTRGLKLLAKEIDCQVIALSQLSRAPDNRPGTGHRPILSDLRESGSIEQDADVVAFVFREEVYKPDRDDLRGMAELIIAKQREGPTGTVKFAYLKQFTRFEQLFDQEDLTSGQDQ